MSGQTKFLNAKANIKQHTGADWPINPRVVNTDFYENTSTLNQTVINLSFSVDQTLKNNFGLWIDGKLLREGASNDYTFTSISAANTSSTITLNSALPANLNIIAKNSNYVRQVEPTNANLQALLDEFKQPVFLKDVKASGTDGGTFTSGAWQTRDLNTVENPQSWLSLSSNQFTLQPGTYEIEAFAPASGTGYHKAKLRNITDSTDVIIGESSWADGTSSSSSIVCGVFTIIAQKTFEIQHRATGTQVTNGFGGASSFSVNEVYTQVKLRKVS